jgi:hypothetical protein
VSAMLLGPSVDAIPRGTHINCGARRSRKRPSAGVAGVAANFAKLGWLGPHVSFLMVLPLPRLAAIPFSLLSQSSLDRYTTPVWFVTLICYFELALTDRLVCESLPLRVRGRK